MEQVETQPQKTISETETPNAGGMPPKKPKKSPRASKTKRLPGHRADTPRGAGTWQRVLLGVATTLLAMVLLGVGYLDGKLSLIHYNDGSVDSIGTIDAGEDQDLNAAGLAENNGEMAMPAGSPFSDSNVLNILLISTDERTEAVNDAAAFTHLDQLDGTSATTEYSPDARADSLILASLNLREDTVKLVSIERGTGVPILLPEYDGQCDWITHTFRYGGARLTMRTVEDCFNVEVAHYVRFNFNSFVEIVDAVGGIDLTLTEEEAKAMNWEVPSNSMLIVNKVYRGKNHMDGYTALQYARLRTIDNDWKRIKRQRTVIQAVLDRIKALGITDLDGLFNTVLPLIQTNFTKSEITALLVQLPGFIGAKAEQMSLPAENTYGVRTGMDNRLMYDPDWVENIRILHDFLYGADSDSDSYPNGATDESAALPDATESAPGVARSTATATPAPTVVPVEPVPVPVAEAAPAEPAPQEAEPVVEPAPQEPAPDEPLAAQEPPAEETASE